jgi:hypothetical protein
MAAMNKAIVERDLQGLKHFRSLRKLLVRLHSVGTARDTAGNRQLHMDQYCVLILLWLFNPAIRTLRGLQRTAEFGKVRKLMGVNRTSLGSLSESVRIFDPEQLKELATELSHRLPSAGASNFDALQQQLTAVDGSVVNTVIRVARLSWTPKGKGKSLSAYRLHTQFEVLRGIPSRIDVTPANPKGKADERAVLGRTIERDRCYVIDRGYAKFALWNAIVSANSSYVCRVRDNSVYVVERTNELTDADREAGVQSDEIVVLGGRREKGQCPNHPVRLVTVAATPHRARGRNAGPGCDGTLRIATSRLDLPAELIGEIYRQRWLIETFFRMFKQMLGCRHLLSTKQEGVEIQMYCAIIACMLIVLYTGRRPNVAVYEAICFYLTGWATLEELEARIAKSPLQT